MTKGQKWLVLLLLIALIGGGVGYYILSTPKIIPGIAITKTTTAKAETPYGESIEVTLNTGTQTSGSASWVAATATASQDVYTVNGTYKSQEQVTLSYSLSVSYSNVESIKATVKIKAIDESDSSFHEYTLASAKALSGTSPISDSGSTTVGISTHLTDAGASTTSATIQYHVYCEVTATGSISGETLTATIPYTQFSKLVYERHTEQTTADVTPTVSVASWYDILNSPEGAALVVGVILFIAIILVAVRKPKRR